ncbi:MAG: 1-acyl-sn-glycerol-3-phosphate acyltransferase [Myxococcales bacterium]|nr:1-acyl-sn-glycerol-3-phosphate acyltransferase [Myxococcales bacterium]
MRYLSTAFLWGSVLVTLPVGYLLALLLLAVTAPFDPERRALHRFVCGWCHLYLRFWPGWRVRVEGRGNIPEGPCVLVANHQSMADILAVMGLGVDYKFVSKASLFEVPLVGFMMRRLKYVGLERGKQGSHAELMFTCGELLAAGERLLIFPEGTYASGPERLPFKRGAFRIAQKAQVPLVPVVLEGTGALVFEDGPWFSPTGRVTVRVMEPLLPPPKDADDEAWVREVESRYESWLSQPVRRAK